ncbi:hypothetical protein BDZ94DRAFT_418583 [Collybia nuda]|uniref:DUF6534 domain-containing protein n=1 Tax=Collybia nuda TaxID=64659 RepID=A0A9P6CCP4_9AGAR|nr:hypothetical protein BDZ94DRAFT_418583 [Collybia nuda]
MLGGVAIVQVITFTRKSKNDPLGQKLAVWFLWSLDMLHLCFMVHMVYHYLVSNQKDPAQVWSFPAHILMQVILLPVAQWLYVVRIWKITTRNRAYVPAILGILVLFNLVAGIFSTVTLFNTSAVHIKNFIPARTAVIFFLAATGFLDSLIAASLCYSLYKAGTNLRWTDSSFIMLLAYFVNTGAIVSVFSISVLITFLMAENYSYFLVLMAIGTKFYVNSFLGMMNARHYFQPAKPQIQTTLVLHSETSSRCESINNHTQGTSKTINEVGLPLFQYSTTSRSEDIKMVEVMVKKEAHSSKI